MFGNPILDLGVIVVVFGVLATSKARELEVMAMILKTTSKDGHTRASERVKEFYALGKLLWFLGICVLGYGLCQENPSKLKRQSTLRTVNHLQFNSPRTAPLILNSKIHPNGFTRI